MKTSSASEKAAPKTPQAGFRLTIGAKLIALIALLLTTSIAGIAYLSEDMYVTNDKGNIKSISASTTATKVQQVRDVMGGSAEKISFLGNLLAQDVMPADVKAQFTKEIFDKDREFLGVFVEKTDPSGTVFASKAPSPELATLGDPDGQKLLDQVASDKQFNTAQLFGGEPQTSLLKLSDGSWAIALGIPLIQSVTEPSKFTHVAIAFVKQSKIATPFKDPLAGEIYLVDRRGNVLAHSDASRVGENVSASAVVQQLFAGKQGVQSIEYNDRNGELHLASFNFVKFSGTSLGVVSDVPATAAYEAATRIGKRSAYVGLIILFLAFWMGYLYSGTLTRPIKKLVEAAQRIASGDFKINLAPKSRDEIAQLSLAFNDMAKGLEERDRVKDTFNKFHNKEIAEKLLSGEVKLGGERKESTIFFSDVRGFTAMSESMEPEQVVEMLNEYMTRMVSVVLKHQGIVDKYVGDAIMALWGVPLSKDDDTYNALRACLEMRVELAKLNELRLSRGQHALKIGMGLNVGPVIAGNIGSTEKMEYTVIGDSVNLASRMESMTKEYGTDLLVPISIYERLKDRFVWEKCKSAKVKGKSTAIEIYKVRGYIDAQGQPVIIETPYSSYESEKSDKVVHDDHEPAAVADVAVAAPIEEEEHTVFFDAHAPAPLAAPVASATPPPLPESATEITLYLNMSGTILGPFSLQEIEQGLVAKEFPSDSQIGSSESGPWHSAAAHPSLAPKLSLNIPDPLPVTAAVIAPAPTPVAEVTAAAPLFEEEERTIALKIVAPEVAAPEITVPEVPAATVSRATPPPVPFMHEEPSVFTELPAASSKGTTPPPTTTLDEPSFMIDISLLEGKTLAPERKVAQPPTPPAPAPETETVVLELPPLPNAHLKVVPAPKPDNGKPKLVVAETPPATAEDVEIIMPVLEDRPKVA